MAVANFTTRFRLLLAIAALVTTTLAHAAVPSALTPVPAGKVSKQLFDIKSQASPVGINRAALAKLRVQDEMEFVLPNATRYMVVFDRIEDHGGGIRSSVGYLRDQGKNYRVIITTGPSGSFGSITTPETIYRIIPGEGHDWLFDYLEERKLIPPIDLIDDIREAPELLPPSRPAPHASIISSSKGGIAQAAVTQATPTPQAPIDVMVVYTNGLGARLGPNLMTRLYNLVAAANTAYADSEVAMTLRLVNATMVNAADPPTNVNDDNVALDAITPTNGGGVGVYANVEAVRSAAGADLVVYMRSGLDNGGHGIAWIATSSGGSNASLMYSVVTGCVVGCDSVFIHEMGHNMGNKHDRATSAYQALGVADNLLSGGAYPYSFGYFYCASGTLTCNPNLPSGSGGCNTQPACSPANNTNDFGTIMSYFNPVVLKFSNPNISTCGATNTQACGVAGSSDNAQSMNNVRTFVSGVKATQVVTPPGAIQFSAASYVADETAGTVNITVSRVGGSTGVVTVNYATTDGTAKAGFDYTAASGTLSWADGDSTSKIIPVAITNDGVSEGGEYFNVTLSSAGGATGVFLGYPVSATVQINEVWPPGGTFPAGYVTPASSSGAWTTATDKSNEGTTSLRSAQTIGPGANVYANSDLEYTATFPSGNVSFAYYVSSYSSNYGVLEFWVDSNVVFTSGGGETGWLATIQPITAGPHTLRWRFKNRLSFACASAIPAPPGGANCADRAWIDSVVLPLTLASSATSIGSSVNPSAIGQSVTFTATASGGSGTPTGVMTFRDGASVISGCNLVPLSSGSAQCITNALPVGARSITAAYSGNTTYDISTSSVLTQNVTGVLLTVATAGNGTGTVTSSPAGINCGLTCTLGVSPGSTVTLTAAPSGGSTFVGWSGGGCSGTGTCMVTVNAATTVTATFTLPTFNLAVSLAGNGMGSVTSSPAGINCGATCTAPFTVGTTVTLTASPAVGSSFAGWSGGGCAGTGPCMTAVSAATSVTATFTLQAFNLTVTPAGSGSGTVTSSPGGISCGATCTAPYNFGTVVTLTASPAVGSTFTGWSGGGCSGTGTCMVTVNAATTVTATFSLPTFNLAVTLGGTGAGTVTSVPAGINCGVTCSSGFTVNTMVTLSATPNAGSSFSGWSGGGCSGTGTCVVTMSSAQSVTANFALLPEAFPPNCAIPAGWTTPMGATTGWAVATDRKRSGTCSLKSNPMADTNVFGQFAIAQISTTGTYAAGTLSFYYNVDSEPDYDCLRFFVDGAEQAAMGTCAGYGYTGANGNISTWTLVSLPIAAGTHTFTWSYEKDYSFSVGADAGWIDDVTLPPLAAPVDLTVAKSGNGSGSVTGGAINCGVTCTQSVSPGTVITLTASPAAGSNFAGWSGGGCTGTGTCMVTVNAATTVTATFTLQVFNLSVARTGAGTGTVTSSPAGINCGATCSAPYDFGTVVTLTSVANPGSAFTGWSGGGCSGTGSCITTVSAAATVTATFGIANTVPGAPTIVSATPGAGQATIAFAAPASNGGAAITGYTVSCVNGGTITGTGLSSPITVSPLTNGLQYSCSVVATNSVGNSLPSASLNVTPAALVLTSVVSRKSHGAFGNCDIPVPLGVPILGSIAVEPRIASSHNLLLTFNGIVNTIGGISVKDPASVNVGSGLLSAPGGNTLTATLSAIPDNKRVTVTLNGLNGSTNATFSLGFLVGDVSGNGVVNVVDISGVKTQSGQTLTATNCRMDLNVTGGVSQSDISAVKARSGITLQ